MIKILVDSASDIDKKEAEKYGITMIPMIVSFGEQEYLDGVNLSHKQFFEKLIENNEFPKTSQINEFRFDEVFEELTKNGDEVIAILISSKLSGTFNSAKQAVKKYKEKVFVVDSLNACIGERILIELAIRLVKDGKNTAQEIVEILEKKKKDIKLLAIVDTLKYLRKGGRISSVAALTGEILSIKPVISITDGEVKIEGKAMGSKNANNLLLKLLNNCGGIDFNLPFTLAYSGLSDEILKKYLKDSENLWKDKAENIPYYMIGSTIGAHAGPGAIAVAFFANSNKEVKNDKK